MIGDSLRDAVKLAQAAIEDCFDVVSDEVPDENVQAEIYQSLDEADVNLRVVSGLAQSYAQSLQ